MPTRRQLIQKITLNSTGGNIIFSNIPQNYTDLKIVVSARYALSGIPSIRMRFNSDSGNNYTNRVLEGNGSTAISTAESSTNNIFIGNVPGSATTSNTFCNIESYIPNYSSSNNKSVLSKSVTENNATTAYINSAAGLWSNASSINSINIYLTDLAANSTFYLYGITHVPIIRGGEVITKDGFKYHIFKSSGSLQVIEPGDIEYLIVAGGGGGGSQSANGGGGGGGAGGMAFGKTRTTGNGVYTVQVGAGGSGGIEQTSDTRGNLGSDSSLLSVTCYGGGGGGAWTESSAGLNGGSGGGGAYNDSNTAGGTATKANISYQSYGNNGAAGTTNSPYHGGGGGGAGAAGSPSASGSHGGIGRNDMSSWANLSATGQSGYYAGGGGGGRYNGGTSSGGLGGGGNGGRVGINAIQYTGGGGGAGAGGDTQLPGENGGNGGSGIVIIRYPYDGN